MSRRVIYLHCGFKFYYYCIIYKWSRSRLFKMALASAQKDRSQLRNTASRYRTCSYSVECGCMTAVHAVESRADNMT